MKDYLMNGPALDIPVYMTVDNGTGDPNNGRFILRRNQNNPTSNEFLLLFWPLRYLVWAEGKTSGK